MKKILMIGAGDYQTPAIKRIHQLGYDVYSVDYKEGQPGFEFSKGYKIIDVKDKDACLKYAKALEIDGVLTWGSTLTLPTIRYIGESLNIPCISKTAAEISISKYAIRKCLDEYGLNSKGETFRIESIDDIQKRDFPLPLVIKPSDGSGSKGVIIVTKKNELFDAINYAFEGARNKEIYAEPYISGKEFTVEAYVYNDICYIYSIIKTEFFWNDQYPIYKQTTYLGINDDIECQIEAEVTKAIKALNLNWGPINFDIIISDDDNKPYIIDVGIRNGQNLIASHIVPYSRGINELDNNISICLRNEIDIKPKFKKYISSRLLIYPPGTIKKIKEVSELIGSNHIVDIIMRKKEGDVLPAYKTKSDICGWVLTDGKTPEEASKYADFAWNILKNYIIIE